MYAIYFRSICVEVHDHLFLPKLIRIYILMIMQTIYDLLV